MEGRGQHSTAGEEVWAGCDVVLLLSDGRQFTLTCLHSHMRRRAIFNQTIANPFYASCYHAADNEMENCSGDHSEIQRTSAFCSEDTNIKTQHVMGSFSLKPRSQKLNLCATWFQDVFWQFSWSCMTSGESRPQQHLELHWTWKCLLIETDDNVWWQMAGNLLGWNRTRFQDFLQKTKNPHQSRTKTCLKGFPSNKTSSSVSCYEHTVPVTESLLWARLCTLISIPAGNSNIS